MSKKAIIYILSTFYALYQLFCLHITLKLCTFVTITNKRLKNYG